MSGRRAEDALPVLPPEAPEGHEVGEGPEVGESPARRGAAGPRPGLPIRLAPPETKPVSSAAALPDAWYVACEARALGRKPLGLTLLGRPLVLYRDGSGRPAALLDRCPHRNVPLSHGRVADGALECGYHGWRFDRTGGCTRVPGLCGEAAGKARQVSAHATVEQEGLVWIYGRPEVQPALGPPNIPCLGAPGYRVVREVFEARGTLHAVAENALDVPHTAFLHRGLFRQDGDRRTIAVTVRRFADRVEAQFDGEQPPTGLLGRILAPRAGNAPAPLEHFDRFLLPNIAQVEYRMGAPEHPRCSHILITSLLTPISDFETRVFALVCFKLPLPGALVSAVLRPMARRIFAQDKRMLAAQTDTVQAFGGERFASTELDLLGQHMRALLRGAERASADGPVPARDPFAAPGAPTETRALNMQV